MKIANNEIKSYHCVQLDGTVTTELENGTDDSFLLLLQGRPIAEPVVQHGPFVMNTAAEIQRAIDDYRETQFGGWPWPDQEQVHPLNKGRFARYADGREEIK